MSAYGRPPHLVQQAVYQQQFHHAASASVAPQFRAGGPTILQPVVFNQLAPAGFLPGGQLQPTQQLRPPSQPHYTTIPRPVSPNVPNSRSPVPVAWVRTVAGAAYRMDGTTLAACVDDTQSLSFLNVPPSLLRLMGGVTGDSSTAGDIAFREAAAAEVHTFMVWLRNALLSEITIAASKASGNTNEEALASPKRIVEPFVALATAVLVLYITRALQGPSAEGCLDMRGGAASSNLPDAQQKGRRQLPYTAQDDTMDPIAILDGTTNATRNVYLRALTTSFDLLQELHVGKRGPQHANGFPGWDTAVIICFVHVIQSVSQTIKEIDGELLGDIMRNWRKLFVFLQTSDAEVPKELSRRRGALAVANSLLILLFQQDNTHQCRIILNTIESAEKLAESQKDPHKSIIASSSHLVAEMVKFRYYQGRIRLYDRNYEGAFAAFSEANRLLPPIAQSTDVSSVTPLAEGLAHPLAWGTIPAGETIGSAVVSWLNPPPAGSTAPPEAPVPKGMNAAQRDNKLRVVFYQVTCAILCGLRVPLHSLSTDPNAAKALRPIIAAVYNGSPAAYTMALDLHGHFLRLRGVFMLLQQGRLYCYLALLQRVHGAVTVAGKDSSMIPISLVVESLAAANHACCDASSAGYLFAPEERGTDVQLAGEGNMVSNSEVFRLVKKLRVEVDAQCEEDDIIAWIGRLIARGLVRGYLSYEHKMLVLSKKEPFPAPQYTFALL